MNFHFDLDGAALYVTFQEGRKVALTQSVSNSVSVDIGNDGRVIGVEVLSPGTTDWQIPTLLDRYADFTMAEVFFLVTLAERKALFNFADA